MPSPALVTVRVWVSLDSATKVTLTVRASVIDTWHTPIRPEHAPDHDPKLYPLSGSAVSVTSSPSSKSAVHVAPQSIPVCPEATCPLPPLTTVKLKVMPIIIFRVNSGVTVRASLITT